MKIKAFTILFLFQFIILATLAQKNAGLGALLDKNGRFIFPQTSKKVSAALQVEAIFSKDANDEENVKWITKSGLAVYTTLDENKKINEIWFGIPDDKVLMVSGLPYHLTLNKTTVQEIILKFKKYTVKRTKPELYDKLEGGTKLEVKIADRYVTLFFDKKNVLNSVYILRSFIDSAAG